MMYAEKIEAADSCTNIQSDKDYVPAPSEEIRAVHRRSLQHVDGQHNSAQILNKFEAEWVYLKIKWETIRNAQSSSLQETA